MITCNSENFTQFRKYILGSIFWERVYMDCVETISLKINATDPL